MVTVWRPGFPVLRLFVVYIARAPSNYCADATPTRGVWSQIHSLCHNLSRLYTRPDRSNVDTFMKHARLTHFLSVDKSFTLPHVHTNMLPLHRTIGTLLTPGVVISSRNNASQSITPRCVTHYVPIIRGSEERSEIRARVRSELLSIR